MQETQPLVTATRVTIAEPEDTFGNYLECPICGQCFDDGAPAYLLGDFPGTLIHIDCV